MTLRSCVQLAINAFFYIPKRPSTGDEDDSKCRQLHVEVIINCVRRFTARRLTIRHARRQRSQRADVFRCRLNYIKLILDAGGDVCRVGPFGKLDR